MSKKDIQKYIEEMPKERQKSFRLLQETIAESIPEGFEEVFSYGMIGYVVPHTVYPSGYHCDPKLPLPFINIGNQKSSINLYHLGIYADEKLLLWFQKQWPKYSDRKLDMGKSCIRFKDIENIPYELVSKLVKKMTVEKWIKLYEKNVKK